MIDVVKLAKEAEDSCAFTFDQKALYQEFLERFANLVRNATLEECASRVEPWNVGANAAHVIRQMKGTT